LSPILVDTSFLIAVYDRTDAFHSRCVKAHHAIDNPLVTCEAVIAESLFMLRFVYGAASAVLASIEQGALEIQFNLGTSAVRVRKLMDKYADTPASLADACIIQMADELDTGDILTLDSDFRHYRWRRNRSFKFLVPLD
jgi:predicted nucleic acid-binding protein